MRRFHAFAGLAGFALVIFMAVTGFVLSLQPLLDAVTTAPAGGVPNVAEVAAQVAEQVPGVERLVRSASGQLVAYGFDGTARTSQIVDPNTGEVIGAYAPSPVFAFFAELHRSLFLGGAGHIVSGIASFAILVLSLSGIVLLIRKMGGWRQLLGRARGTGSQRLHTNLARAAVLALLLTATTGTYMSAVYFELVPSAESGFAFAPVGEGTTPAPIASLTGLASIPLTDLRELVFPAIDDPSDVFTITTHAGLGYVDQATGAMLSFTPNSAWQQFYELVYTLHTGEGAWMLAVRPRHGCTRRPGPRCHRFRHLVAPPSQHPARQAQCVAARCRHDHSRRQRVRQYLGVCREPARSAQRRGQPRASRGDERSAARPTPRQPDCSSLPQPMETARPLPRRDTSSAGSSRSHRAPVRRAGVW